SALARIGVTSKPLTTISQEDSPLGRLRSLPSKSTISPGARSLAASAFLPHTSHSTNVACSLPSEPRSVMTRLNDAQGVPLVAYFTVTPYLPMLPSSTTLLTHAITFVSFMVHVGSHLMKL